MGLSEKKTDFFSENTKGYLIKYIRKLLVLIYGVCSTV